MSLWLDNIFRFFGEISNGVAYAIGLSLGFSIWWLLKRLLAAALFGGGTVLALERLGMPAGSLSGVVAWFQNFPDISSGLVSIIN